METYHNDRSHRPLLNLQNRVLAVVDDSAGARAAIEELVAAGVPGREMTAITGEQGVRQIDADGQYGGLLTRVVRAFQRLSVEGSHLQRYQEEVSNGRSVVDVHADPTLWRAVVKVLRRHGGHFINAYSPWMVEELAA